MREWEEVSGKGVNVEEPGVEVRNCHSLQLNQDVWVEWRQNIVCHFNLKNSTFKSILGENLLLLFCWLFPNLFSYIYNNTPYYDTYKIL